jgi:hypothetical protein
MGNLRDNHPELFGEYNTIVDNSYIKVSEEESVIHALNILKNSEIRYNSATDAYVKINGIKFEQTEVFEMTKTLSRVCNELLEVLEPREFF